MNESLTRDRISLARGLLNETFNAMPKDDERREHLLVAWSALTKADVTVDREDGS